MGGVMVCIPFPSLVSAMIWADCVALVKPCKAGRIAGYGYVIYAE